MRLSATRRQQMMAQVDAFLRAREIISRQHQAQTVLARYYERKGARQP